MTGAVALGPMDTSDVAPVAALLADSFDGGLHRYIAYCSPQVEEYLATVAGCPPPAREQDLLVARSDVDGVLAFAEFRSLDDGGRLLSYVCVAAAARGQRLAEKMMRAHLGRCGDAVSLDLDVFAHNAAARRLYERLGFEAVRETEWWARDLPGDAVGAPGVELLRVRDWHLTVAALDRYGFGMMDAVWRGLPLRLALPSRTVVRVGDPRWFADDALLAALRTLVPTLEECLMIGRPDGPAALTGSHVLTSIRMRAPLPLVGEAP